MGTQYGGSEEPGMSVEELVALIQNLNPQQRIPDAAFHVLFHFDSRATALLLKDLSKAGSSSRATELFEWLRGLEAGHPLQVRLLSAAAWARQRKVRLGPYCGTVHADAERSFMALQMHMPSSVGLDGLMGLLLHGASLVRVVRAYC